MQEMFDWGSIRMIAKKIENKGQVGVFNNEGFKSLAVEAEAY